MRQPLINQPLASSARPTGRRRSRERNSGTTLALVRKFIVALMFLAPIGALGTLCFALVQNNLKLHQKNNELTGIANEVRTEIDVLSEEIETLQQRAGVLEAQVSPGAAQAESANSIEGSTDSDESTI